MPRNETARPGKRPLRSLSAQDKMKAIKRVHDGESKAAVARDIGVPESTLRGWCKSEQKIITQVNSQASTSDQCQTVSVSSPSIDSNGSTPRSTPPNSNLPTNGAHLIASTSTSMSDPSNVEIETMQIAKRARLENGMTSAGIGTSIHTSYNDEINGLVTNQQSLYTYIDPESLAKGMLVLQHLKLMNQSMMYNAGNTVITAASSSGASTSMSPSAVGLIENGLQYVRTNGTTNPTNNTVNRRKSRSPVQIERCTQQIMETPRSSTVGQISPSLMSSFRNLPMIASLFNETQLATTTTTTTVTSTAIGRRNMNKSLKPKTKTKGKTMNQIAMSLSLQVHVQQLLEYQKQQQLRTDQTCTSIKLLLEWYNLYMSLYAVIMEAPHLRNFMSRLQLDNVYPSNNNNEEEENDDISTVGLHMAIRNGIMLIQWLERYGLTHFCQQLVEVRDIVTRMQEWAKCIRKERLNPTS